MVQETTHTTLSKKMGVFHYSREITPFHAHQVKNVSENVVKAVISLLNVFKIQRNNPFTG